MPSKFDIMEGSFTVVQDQLEVGLWEPGRPQTTAYYTCSVKELMAHPLTNPKKTFGIALSAQRELMELGQPSVLKKMEG